MHRSDSEDREEILIQVRNMENFREQYRVQFTNSFHWSELHSASPSCIHNLPICNPNCDSTGGVGLKPLSMRCHMRCGPCVCIPGVRQGAGGRGIVNTCRSCRLSRSLVFLGCIGPSFAPSRALFQARTSLLHHIFFGLLAVVLKPKAALNSVSASATECAGKT
jgi:hypothetical protein